MMTCRRIRQMVDDVVMGRSRPEETQALAHHIEGCEACRRAYEEALAYQDLVAQVRQSKGPGGSFTARTLARIESEGVAPRQADRVWGLLSTPTVAVSALAVACGILLIFGFPLARKPSDSTKPDSVAVSSGADSTDLESGSVGVELASVATLEDDPFADTVVAEYSQIRAANFLAVGLEL